MSFHLLPPLFIALLSLFFHILPLFLIVPVSAIFVKESALREIRASLICIHTRVMPCRFQYLSAEPLKVQVDRSHTKLLPLMAARPI